MPVGRMTDYLTYQYPDGGVFNFFGPSGLPISPDLLCWQAFEAHVYVGAPTAVHLRQTRQARRGRFSSLLAGWRSGGVLRGKISGRSVSGWAGFGDWVGALAGSVTIGL